ncbi:PspC domain-containing protein [bacterium]|nr:PspC domain-containing protein [bacterium]
MTEEKNNYTRLYRSRTEKVLGGICGGLGEYLKMDPVVLRIIWIATILLGGTGILAYLIAWILIPEEPLEYSWHKPKEESKPTSEEKDNQQSNGSRVLGALLIVIATLWLGYELNFFPIIPWEWVWPLGLIALGIALLLRPQILKVGRKAEETTTTESGKPEVAPEPAESKSMADESPSVEPEKPVEEPPSEEKKEESAEEDSAEKKDE